MGEPHCDSLDAFGQKLQKTMDIPAAHASSIRVFFEVFGPSFASDDFVKSVAGFFERLGAFYGEQIKLLQSSGSASAKIDPAIAGRALAAMMDGVILHRGLFDLPVKRHRAMIKQSIALLIDGLRDD